MNITPHKRACAVPAGRREIRQLKLSEGQLALKYGISRDTVQKRSERETVEDYSHRPHAMLPAAEEAVAVELRRTLPPDDSLVFVREFIRPDMSRSAPGRCTGFQI